GVPEARSQANACAQHWRDILRYLCRRTTQESPRRPPLDREKGALAEPGTQWRPLHCKSVSFGTGQSNKTFSPSGPDSIGNFEGHPEEASREENKTVIDRSNGVAAGRRRRVGTRHEQGAARARPCRAAKGAR